MQPRYRCKCRKLSPYISKSVHIPKEQIGLTPSGMCFQDSATLREREGTMRLSTATHQIPSRFHSRKNAHTMRQRYRCKCRKLRTYISTSVHTSKDQFELPPSAMRSQDSATLCEGTMRPSHVTAQSQTKSRFRTRKSV